MRYRSFATKVTSTGGGVSNIPIGEDDVADSLEDLNSINSEDSSMTAWIASVPREGPDHDTLECARNVWGMFAVLFFALLLIDSIRTY